MPPRQTKTNLKSRRVQTRLRKNTTRRMRSRAKYLHRVDLGARVKEGLYAAEKALLVASAYEPVEKGRTAFDSLYSSADVAKIATELARATTRPEEVVAKVRAALPRRRLTLRSILLMFLLAWMPAADAKWNEWSAPPDEYSLFDTLYVVSYFVQLSTGFAAKRLDPVRAAQSLFISGVAEKVTTGIRAAAGSQRLYDSATGKYPLDAEQKAYMGVEVAIPLKLAGSTAVTRILEKGETAQLAYTIKEKVMAALRPAAIDVENKALLAAIEAGATEGLLDVEAVAGTATPKKIDV